MQEMYTNENLKQFQLKKVKPLMYQHVMMYMYFYIIISMYIYISISPSTYLYNLFTIQKIYGSLTVLQQ